MNFGCLIHCAALHRIALQCGAMEYDAFWCIAAQCAKFCFLHENKIEIDSDHRDATCFPRDTISNEEDLIENKNQVE